MYQYLLCINVRPQNVADFTKISARIARLAPEIAVLGRPGDYHESMIPPELVHLPRLTIYLVNPPAVPDSRGHTLAVAKLSKHWQHENFLRNGITVPESMPFAFGMKVNRDIFGDTVVLKPIEGSFGSGIYLLTADQLESINDSNVAETHPLQSSPYFVQRFIETEGNRTNYRVVVFLGEPVLMYKVSGGPPMKPQSTLDAALETEIFTGDFSKRMRSTPKGRSLDIEQDIVDFAVKVFNVHPDKPLQGIDVIREKSTGKLFTFECNAGGNVWTFSRPGAPTLEYFGQRALVEQFNAWVVSADALIRKTRELAC